MTALTMLIGLLVGVTATFCTGWLRRHALRARWLDVPNDRSSHSVPTPSSGGLAIIVSATIGLSALALLGSIDAKLWIALVLGGITVASVGFIDDRRSLPPLVRLAVHIGAAIFAVAALGGVSPLQVGTEIIDLGWAGHALGVVAVVWTLNLFNFMDGIDGIAASEAIFVAGAAALLATLIGAVGQTHAAGLVFCTACTGFLAWNWPPARIFMGDVGSGYLGYMVAVLALAGGHRQPNEPFVWLALGGAFFADATITLVRRLLRGERLYEAHRLHAYQRLARRWHSHGRVTASLVAVNLAWSAPLAATAALRPTYAATCAVLSVVGWLTIAVVSGSGSGRDTAGSDQP